MKLDLYVTTSREDIENLILNEPFSKSIEEREEYSFYVFLKIYSGRTLVAELNGMVFDEDKIMNDGNDMTDVADMHYGDVYGAICTLMKSNIYKEELDIDLMYASPYSSYIERVYINPKYRNKGVGKYIFNQLYDIFLHCLNIHTRCFVICPKPQLPDDKKNWINATDEDGSKKKLMIDVIKKSGYKRIGKSEFYAINCMT